MPSSSASGCAAGGGAITVMQGAVTGYTSASGTLGKDLIKTDAAISFGNSGGPVLDADGQLIGVASLSRVTTTIDGASVDTSRSGLVRPVAAAGALIAIARTPWTPRPGYTSVDLAPTSIEPEPEGVTISTRVVDQANDQRDGRQHLRQRGEVEHRLAQPAEVQRAEGLIQQQDLWLMSQSTG